MEKSIGKVNEVCTAKYRWFINILNILNGDNKVDGMHDRISDHGILKYCLLNRPPINFPLVFGLMSLLALWTVYYTSYRTLLQKLDHTPVNESVPKVASLFHNNTWAWDMFQCNPFSTFRLLSFGFYFSNSKFTQDYSRQKWLYFIETIKANGRFLIF